MLLFLFATGDVYSQSAVAVGARRQSPRSRGSVPSDRIQWTRLQVDWCWWGRLRHNPPTRRLVSDLTLTFIQSHHKEIIVGPTSRNLRTAVIRTHLFIPATGMGGLPYTGVGSLPYTGVGSLPYTGMGGPPYTGVGGPLEFL